MGGNCVGCKHTCEDEFDDSFTRSEWEEVWDAGFGVWGWN